jgi:hypothetical protein
MSERSHSTSRARRTALPQIFAITLALPMLVAAGIALADWQPGLQATLQCPPVLAQAEARQP